ncbi:MAG: proline iminopeptidase-family hydrolase [Deltaproteobacteria bacterium]|nr:proline iminopeptidase-family hydrolase [Deltaproteobacteria bacterium]
MPLDQQPLAQSIQAEPSELPAPARELRVPVTGGSLYVRVDGDLSRPQAPLLLLHGGPGGDMRHHLAALPLARERALVFYDQLDSGRSDSPGDPALWTLDRFVSEIDAVRDALALRELHLLGHSWGATLANLYAARRPKGLRSLILQGPSLSAQSWEASVKRWLPLLPDGAGAVMEAHERAGTLQHPDYLAARRIFERAHVTRTAEPPWMESYRRTVPKNHGAELYQAMIGGSEIYTGGLLADFDHEPLLAQIEAPTLMLCGEFDEMSPVECARLAGLLARGSLAVIPGAGHMAQYDNPVAWRAEVSFFVSKHD